ncbi:MAG: malate/lactate/ureidoglycolate dehydrogenase [Acidimicrobiales bacterium]
MAADDVVLSAYQLEAVVRAIVAQGGSSDYEANLVAVNLVEANLTGHDSHGVGMIPRYVDAALEGGLAVNQHPTVVLDTGPLLSVEGNHGYGQVIGQEAMGLAIDRAKRHGVCVLALANSHHIGRIGFWAEQAVAAGLVSVHFVNVFARPIVAPWGGGDARFGTNPFCVGIPHPGREPIILDFATSRIAQGKTRVAYNKGEALAPGVVIDDAGRPTTDPRFTVVAPFGALLPFGEHKGSGLALVCEILGAALTGGRSYHERVSGHRWQVLNSMLAVLVDPEHLGAAAHLAAETEAIVAWATGSPPGEGFDKVRVAGEPEREIKQRRLAEGIPVDAVTWADIVKAGEKLGLARERVERIAALDPAG